MECLRKFGKLHPRRAAWALCTYFAAGALLLAGCARIPPGVNTATGPQLIITMQVAGQINPTDYYFVLFNTTSTPAASVGPIPVIASPWGNGFATGDITQFLRFDPTQPSNGYGMYIVVPGTNNLSFSPLPGPVQYTTVASGGSTLQFQIPVSELATSSIAAADITTVQVNFLAMNYIETIQNDPTTKLFNALGDASVGDINEPITILTTQPHVYDLLNSPSVEIPGPVMETGPSGIIGKITDNSQTQPSGVGTDADLQIVNWSIQVNP